MQESQSSLDEHNYSTHRCATSICGLFIWRNTMDINKIIQLLNDTLAGETLTEREALTYLDFAIDDINGELNSAYPTFTEFRDIEDSGSSYDLFDDRYIRNTVIPGAAWRFYVIDEEGLQTAVQHKEDFDKGKFKMLRDMLYTIPDKYRADDEQGFIIGNPTNDTVGNRGLELDLDGLGD